ncbi:hypothetical protein C8J56DRAFT_433042 [Mycena floridula]|nr:hypothetical protein C8J56DRAFT_433042 [Mycena floridula]
MTPIDSPSTLTRLPGSECSIRGPQLSPFMYQLLEISELLAEVFFNCLPDHGNPNAAEAPLLLCRVCRRWDQVARRSPRLWTHLSISVGPSKPSTAQVDKWLACSGALPLTLSLNQRYPFQRHNVSARKIMNVFKRYSSRWQTVALEFPTWDSLGSLDFSGAQAPNSLQSFVLSSSHPHNESVRRELSGLLSLVGTASSLSHLEVLSTAGIGVQRYFVPASVTNLRLHNVLSVELMLGILLRCPNLATLHVEFDPNGHVGDIGMVDVLEHSTLHTMEGHLRLEQFQCLLRHLALPALQELSLYVSCNFFPQIDFLDFFSRSRCKLRTLELCDTGISGAQVIECIGHSSFAGLSQLSLMQNYSVTWQQVPSVTQEVIEALTINQGHSIVLPKLENLIIRGWCMESCLSGVIIAMVKSRWKKGTGSATRMKRLVLKHEPKDFEEDYASLGELEKEGFELELCLSDWCLDADDLPWLSY